MAKIKKMITNNSIVLIIKDKKHVVNRFGDVKGGVPVENATAQKVLAVLKEAETNPDLLDADTSPILALIDINVKLKDSPFYIDKVQCKVYVDGEEVNPYLSKKIIAASEAGKYYEHIVNFWKRLKNNPLESARNELFLYLEHNGLPLTKEGYFISYKSVRNDYYSSYNYREGSKDNVLNLPGTWVTEKRENVDHNRDRTCSNGLHAANYNYAVRIYGSPKHITLIIDPADVVTIPSDYNNQKMRTSAYYVLEDCKGEYKGEFVDNEYNLPAKPEVYGVRNVPAPTPVVEKVVEPVIEEVVQVEEEVVEEVVYTVVNDDSTDTDINYYEKYINVAGVVWTYSGLNDNAELAYSSAMVDVKIPHGDRVFATWKPVSSKVVHTFNKPGIVKKAINSFGQAISNFVGNTKPVRGPDGRFISTKKTGFQKAISSFIGTSNLPKRGPDGRFLKR